MHPYFASQVTLASRVRLICIQDTLSSRARLGIAAAFRPSVSREQRYLAYKRLISFVQPVGQVSARAKVSCIQSKARQRNFRSAHKEVVLFLVCM